MKVRFLEDRDTVKYGPVKIGQIETVSTADGEAFIKSIVAEEVKAIKPKKEKG